ncbi:hypothetical protein L7F22_061950 [Adiantum nelumboides]|nr:hypothetical protein [Adiantum nelumboides]
MATALAVPHPFNNQLDHPRSKQVCRYWLQQRCTRRSCPFAHPAAPVPGDSSCPPKRNSWQRPSTPSAHRIVVDQRQQHANPRWSRHGPHAPALKLQAAKAAAGHKQRSNDTNAHYCSTSSLALSNTDLQHHEQRQQQCLAPALVSAFNLNNMTGLAASAGHPQAGTVRGMALPLSSDTLFTIGDDAALHAWSATAAMFTGQDHIQQATCSHQLIPLPHRPQCLFHSFCDPDWLFVGLASEVRVCNLRTHSQHSLSVGSPVLSMASLGSLLLAGLEDGNIVVWRFDASSSSFQAVVSLSSSRSSNHVFDDKNSKLSAVLSLEPCVQGSTIVYAGLANGTIQVWDVASASCCQVLSGAHSKAVTHLLTCDQISALFSASQDGSIKMWTISGADRQYSLELQKILNCPQPAGADANLSCAGDVASWPLALCGVVDGSTNTPVLFASYSNSQVHILDLPSLAVMSTISTKDPISTMDTGPSRLLMLGSTSGELSAWRWK